MSSYKIVHLINNSEADRLYEAAFNDDGTFLVLGKTTIPNLGQGTQPPIDGSFEVFEIDYMSGRRFQDINQIGNTVTGTSNELLGAKVGMSSDGSIVLASSATCLFRLYSQNGLTGVWEQFFAPPDGMTPYNIGGFRYCRDLHNILTAHVHVGSMGETEIYYYRRNGPTYETPSYTSDLAFTNMFTAVRGLSISSETVNNSSIVVHVEMGTQPQYGTINILELGQSSYNTYGTITKFDNSDDYSGLSVAITSNASIIAITSYKDFVLTIEFFKYDTGSWVSIKEMYLVRDTNEFAFSYIYLSDTFVGDYPEKFLLSGVSGLAQDSIYGIYEYDLDSDSYIQKNDIKQKLNTLIGSTDTIIGFGEAAVSRDVNVFYKTFLKLDGSNNILPMNYNVNPEFQYTLPNVASDGIAGMILANSIESVAINAGNYTVPGPYTFDLAADLTFQQYLTDNNLTVVSYSDNISAYNVNPSTGVVTITGGGYGSGGSFGSVLDGILVTTITSPFFVELSGSWSVPPEPEPESEGEPEGEGEAEPEDEAEEEPEAEDEPEAEEEPEDEPTPEPTPEEETPTEVSESALTRFLRFLRKPAVLITIGGVSVLVVAVIIIIVILLIL